MGFAHSLVSCIYSESYIATHLQENRHHWHDITDTYLTCAWIYSSLEGTRGFLRQCWSCTLTVRAALWFHYEPWSTCCNSCPASCGRNMGCIICGFQNVISCRFGGSHSSNRTALPRLVCLHQELALSSFSSAAELVSCLCAALGPSPTLRASMPGTQLLACSPSLLPLPRHQGPGAGRKLQAPGAACAILFQTHAALRRAPTYAWSQTESFSVLRTLPGALGLERGRENVKRIERGHWLCNKNKAISQAVSSLPSPNLLAPLCAGWRNLRSLWYLAEGFVAK